MIYVYSECSSGMFGAINLYFWEPDPERKRNVLKLGSNKKPSYHGHIPLTLETERIKPTLLTNGMQFILQSLCFV